MRLKDRICLITGGGRGLGRDFALAFTREGAHVALAGTSEALLHATAAEARASGQRALTVVCDVADDAAVDNLVKTTLAEFGRIDVLVNNAGVAGPTALAVEVKLRDWERTLAINLTGAWLCAKAVLPQMIERRQGKIINISSMAGHKGYAYRSPYAASKWGMIGLSQSLALEYGKYNIQVNTISPGPVRGDRIDEVIRNRAAQMNAPLAEVEKQYTSLLALGRFVEPEHVAAAAVFLAASESDSITGEVIQVSCGQGI